MSTKRHSFITLIHSFVPRAGVNLLNVLSFAKILILLLVVLSGVAVLCGWTRIEDPYASFRDPFEGTELSAYFVAMASFKVPRRSVSSAGDL